MRNSEEGGRAIFWGDDVDSDIDDKWAEQVRKLLMKKSKQRTINSRQSSNSSLDKLQEP